MSRPGAPAAPDAACDAHAWLAEAAMHRILRRTLPAQRHEVLGALSALKLQLAVARRRAAGSGEGGQDEDADSRLARLEGMVLQQQAAQDALAGLRLWDGMTVQRKPLAEVAGQAVAWVRQAAAMRGHRLDDLALDELTLDALAGGTPAAAALVQVPAAHHLVLGLLYEALDRLDSPSVLTLHLGAEGQGWRLWLAASRREQAPPAVVDSPAGAAPAGQAAPRIDAAMLAALASHAAAVEGRWRCLPGDRAAGTGPWLTYAARP